MNATLFVPAPAVARARARRLPQAAAFALLASIVVSFLAGSSVPTPLYALYQAEWGFSAITITVVFGVYTLGVLASLLTVGALSDHVGRRPVLFVAVALQAVTMLLFITAHGVPGLLVARVVQGLSTGSALGAIGAGMIDIDRARGTVANAVAPMLGSAAGGFISGLLVQFLPAPTVLVYAVLFGVFVLQGIGVVFVPETAARRPGALASLRPHLRLPAAVRGPMLLVAPLLVATWALLGFYGALAPTLVRRLVGSSSVLLGGLSLFAIATSGAVAVLLLNARSARSLMIVGAAALATGVVGVLWAVAHASVIAFFAGTMVAGAGVGTGFQGSIRSVIPLAEAHVRAGVLSVLFLISYLAMGLPAVLAGVGVVYGGGVAATARVYGAAVIVLALAALAGAAARRAPARA